MSNNVSGLVSANFPVFQLEATIEQAEVDRLDTLINSLQDIMENKTIISERRLENLLIEIEDLFSQFPKEKKPLIHKFCLKISKVETNRFNEEKVNYLMGKYYYSINDYTRSIAYFIVALNCFLDRWGLKNSNEEFGVFSGLPDCKVASLKLNELLDSSGDALTLVRIIHLLGQSYEKSSPNITKGLMDNFYAIAFDVLLALQKSGKSEINETVNLELALFLYDTGGWNLNNKDQTNEKSLLDLFEQVQNLLSTVSLVSENIELQVKVLISKANINLKYIYGMLEKFKVNNSTRFNNELFKKKVIDVCQFLFEAHEWTRFPAFENPHVKATVLYGMIVLKMIENEASKLNIPIQEIINLNDAVNKALELLDIMGALKNNSKYFPEFYKVAIDLLIFSDRVEYKTLLYYVDQGLQTANNFNDNNVKKQLIEFQNYLWELIIK